MDWVDRYVEAVKRYLPRKSREDIGAELHSVLEEKVVEVGRASGHAATEGEGVRVEQLRESIGPAHQASRWCPTVVA